MSTDSHALLYDYHDTMNSTRNPTHDDQVWWSASLKITNNSGGAIDILSVTFTVWDYDGPASSQILASFPYDHIGATNLPNGWDTTAYLDNKVLGGLTGVVSLDGGFETHDPGPPFKWYDNDSWGQNETLDLQSGYSVLWSDESNKKHRDTNVVPAPPALILGGLGLATAIAGLKRKGLSKEV
jgi:hypothetical protein